MSTEPQNLNTNQENQSWGGKREGAGRPRGSSNKPQIRNFVTPDEIAQLVELAKKEAYEGKTDMLKFLLEQVFGKARQNLGLDGGDEGEPIQIDVGDEQYKRIIRAAAERIGGQEGGAGGID